jgi:HD-GYP domain-containing protein (c-di-GMP phosphodiesterase class II)
LKPVSSRPYRNGSTCEHALAEIRRNVGSQFDPAVVEAFMRASANGFPDDPDTPKLPERVEAALG